MIEFTLKIDPDTRDFVFDNNGIMETVEGDDVPVQNVDINLNTWKGEFILDDTHGTDYERVLGEGNTDVLDGEADEVIRDGILQEPGVSLITSINASIKKRTLTASYAGELASGAEIASGVTQSG